MTLKIEITAHPDFGSLDEQIEQAFAALGFIRGGRPVLTPGTAPVASKQAAEAIVRGDYVEVSGVMENGELTITDVQKTEAPQSRERGKPSQGRARRTKEEIAEDEAADKADAAAGTTSQISTNPEDRSGPEDDADTAAQDAVDEDAETESKDMTVDDVRTAVNDYVKKYGMPAAQEDGPKIFVEALGAPPAGEAYWKMSLLPDDQPTLLKVVTVWRKATELNPLKRTAV